MTTESATIRAPGRLPGIRFETQAPPLSEVLPRMDVAVFVGFAASGPLDVPVAVESAAQFTAIFGADTPLAWDRQRSVQLQASLAPAVRAFFRNGGRRCWVVRVARRVATASYPLNHARANLFPVPGLLCARFAADGQTITDLHPALAQARAEGSWSDGLRVSATLATRPLQAVGPLAQQGAEWHLDVEGAAPNEIAPGELLRLRFAPDGMLLLLVVARVEPLETSPPSRRRRARIIGQQALWLAPVLAESPPGAPRAAVAHIYSNALATLTCAATLHLPTEPATAPTPDTRVRLELQGVSLADAPAPGALVQVETGGRQLWLTVSEQGLGAGNTVSLIGSGAWHIASPALPTTTPSGERLAFTLWVRAEERLVAHLDDLAFADSHARYWGRLLPTDEELFRRAEQDPAQTPAIILRPQVGDLFRFPLAGRAAPREVCFPLGLQTVPEHYLPAAHLPGSALERDGLAEFDAALFLDEDLRDAQTAGLLTEADFIRYLAPTPRPLRGIHAALGLEEATLIAVPDAVQRGWTRQTPPAPPAPLPSPSPLRPEWWRFLPCQGDDAPAPPRLPDCEPSAAPPATGPRPAAEPQWGNFLDCAIEVIAPPTLTVDQTVSPTGAFTLAWPSSPPSDPVTDYTVEEAVRPDFRDAVTVYAGQRTQLAIFGRQPGNYYYRAQARRGRNFSDWSNGVVVAVAPAHRWELAATEDFSAGPLLTVQRALLRMSAARGDLFAVLSLPEHYNAEQTSAHLAALRRKSLRGALPVGATRDFLDERTLSFGAVWHPWLIGREEERFEELRAVPPCGAASGLLARRALARGAWIAPANEPLRGVVTLTPAIGRAHWPALQEARLNLIRQEPRGFLTLNAETLSDDPDLRQINVRRLLSLLRRLALRLGATYVFEPHSLAFQRAVRRGFEALLNQMFTRGAFAGATPATAYQVVVDETLNTPRTQELGQFIVELRVAPALPLRFLVVRLVQSAERGVVQES